MFDWRIALDEFERRGNAIRTAAHGDWDSVVELTRAIEPPQGGWGKAPSTSVVASLLWKIARTAAYGVTIDEVWALAVMDNEAARPRLILTIWPPSASMDEEEDTRRRSDRMRNLLDRARARWGDEWEVEVGIGRFGAASAPSKARPLVWPKTPPKTILIEWDSMVRGLWV